MLRLAGILVVIACVFGGYVSGGGHLAVLWVPGEFVIIGGAALGAFLIGNTTHAVKATGKGLAGIFKKDTYGKEEYIELLCMLFVVFKTARTKGWLALEPHVENPHESTLFSQFPKFHHNHHAVTFLCDYLRIVSLGSDKPHELEALMDQELDTQKEERNHVPHAVQAMADGMPALGIVAAVLGVIHTMGSISEPPEVLGKLIGGALVGTFAGVFVSYGFLAPIASAMNGREEAEMKYYYCMKASILAFLQGCAPQVAIEFGRKVLLHDVQPTFLEVEEATQKVEVPK